MKAIKKCLRFLFLILVVYFAGNLLFSTNSYLLNRGIKNQINYLSQELNEDLGAEMQERYPEGLIFSNALLALSILDWENRPKENNKTYAQTIDACIQRISEGKQLFSEQLPLRYGAFYNGWCNYLLKKYIESPIFEYSEIKDEVNKIHQQINLRINSIQKDSLQLLESYHEAIWPADNLVCIASLDDTSAIKLKWFNLVFNQSKVGDSLINHVNSDKAEARGSSLALMQCFINDINPEYSLHFRKSFNQHFKKRVLGMEWVKEYKKEGLGDVDSGPLVFGFGSVATIVNVRANASYDKKTAKRTWRFLHTISLPINLFGKKYYLLKQEPMLDLFLLWDAVILTDS